MSKRTKQCYLFHSNFCQSLGVWWWTMCKCVGDRLFFVIVSIWLLLIVICLQCSTVVLLFHFIFPKWNRVWKECWLLPNGDHSIFVVVHRNEFSSKSSSIVGWMTVKTIFIPIKWIDHNNKYKRFKLPDEMKFLLQLFGCCFVIFFFDIIIYFHTQIHDRRCNTLRNCKKYYIKIWFESKAFFRQPNQTKLETTIFFFLLRWCVVIKIKSIEIRL